MEGKAKGSFVNQFNMNFSDSVRARVKTRRKKLTSEEPLLETNLNGHKKIKGLRAVPAKVSEFDTSQNNKYVSRSPKQI